MYTALGCCSSSGIVYDIHPSFSVFNSNIHKTKTNFLLCCPGSLGGTLKRGASLRHEPRPYVSRNPIKEEDLDVILNWELDTSKDCWRKVKSVREGTVWKKEMGDDKTSVLKVRPHFVKFWGRLHEKCISAIHRIVIFSTATERQKSNDTRNIELARDKKGLQLENVEL